VWLSVGIGSTTIGNGMEGSQITGMFLSLVTESNFVRTLYLSG
jgi:hypothetical protein